MRRLPPIGRPELAGVAAGITCAAVALAAVVAIEVDARSAAAESVAAPAARVDTCASLVAWYRASSPAEQGALGTWTSTTDAAGRITGDSRWAGILLPHTGLHDSADTASSPVVSLAYIPAPRTATDVQIAGALRTMRAAIEYMASQGMPLTDDLRTRADRIARDCPVSAATPPAVGSR
ncbi:hypothetical protein HNP11_004154 [Tsukamurella ocularis]|nr:hypothetical protein [Tsukamurella ocularis]